MDRSQTSRTWMRALANVRSRVNRLREHSATPSSEAIALLDTALEIAQSLLVENGELRRECAAVKQRLEQWLDTLPQPLITTDGAGTILDVNRAAAAILGRTNRGLRGDLLLHLVEDRAALSELMRRFSDSTARQARLRVRPFDRAPFDADIRVVEDPDESGNRLWFLQPALPLRGQGRATSE